MVFASCVMNDDNELHIIITIIKWPKLLRNKSVFHYTGTGGGTRSWAFNHTPIFHGRNDDRPRQISIRLYLDSYDKYV